jgi:hypothetical protein
MVLHARVVLDLWECPEYEIHFEQVEGDFDSFRGKWVFEQLGSQHTLLKYVVETKMQKNCLLAEAIVEEVSLMTLPCCPRGRTETSAYPIRENGVKVSILEGCFLLMIKGKTELQKHATASPNLLFYTAENCLEGPSKGAPLKTCNEGVPYYEIENLQQTLIKMMAAKLTHSEIKQQRNIRGEDPHLSPSNGVELPFTNGP